MNGDQMKLPQVENSAFTSARYLQLEWHIDPAPWVIQRLPDDLVRDIYRIKIQGLAKVVDIQMKQLAVQAEVYTQIAEVLQGEF